MPVVENDFVKVDEYSGLLTLRLPHDFNPETDNAFARMVDALDANISAEERASLLSIGDYFTSLFIHGGAIAYGNVAGAPQVADLSQHIADFPQSAMENGLGKMNVATARRIDNANMQTELEGFDLLNNVYFFAHGLAESFPLDETHGLGTNRVIPGFTLNPFMKAATAAMQSRLDAIGIGGKLADQVRTTELLRASILTARMRLNRGGTQRRA